MTGNGERGSSGMENGSRFKLEDWDAPVYIGGWKTGMRRSISERKNSATLWSIWNWRTR